MASTEQLVRLMKVISEKHRPKGVVLLLWGDGSGSIRVSEKNYSYGILENHTNTVCEWSENMGVELWRYAKELVDESRKHDPSGDPMEDMLQILEG